MRRNRNGFTLLEVLVALAILGTAVALVMQLLAANIRAVVSSERYVAASAAADEKMRELLESGRLSDPASWTENTEDGCRMDVQVTNVLKEKTDHLPVKLVQIDMVVQGKGAAFERPIRLRTLKMINPEQTTGNSQAAGRP